jgi:hypothetical protein
MGRPLDVSYDFRVDSKGRDPDLASPTLREYHRMLWSRTTPTGQSIQLSMRSDFYLVAEIQGQMLALSSDTITNSLSSHKTCSFLVENADPSLVEDVKAKGSTIGARIVFPGKSRTGHQTINVLRGFHPLIRDRFDLTLECIRLYYLGQPSPLSGALQVNRRFFDLFKDFNGYVEFFLLQDLVNGAVVTYFDNFDGDFSRGPYPRSVEEYEIIGLPGLQGLAITRNRQT